MTMTISEALCRIAKLVQEKGESFEDVQAWDVIRSRLEVSGEMVDRAIQAHDAECIRGAFDDTWKAGELIRSSMRAALVAALGE